MKRLCLSIIATCFLLLLPSMAYSADAPPIGQVLVREGDYAVELVRALNLGPARSEADSEYALATLGISPQTGWISDFPVTPDIIAQIQASVEEAVSAGRLSMSREAADKALLALNKELDLAVTSADEGEYAGQPDMDQETVDTYYSDKGPPVITYYEPPPDYAYLYAWDPYPFWYDGFWFPGFFILNDFDIIVVDNRHHHRHHHDGDNYRDGHLTGERVSNHILVPDSGKTVVVDPVTKHPVTQTSFRPVGAKSFDPVVRSKGVNAGSAEGKTQRSYNRKDTGTIYKPGASSPVIRDSSRSSGISDRIRDTSATGRQLPSSMCSAGECGSRSGEARGFSGGGRSVVTPSVGGSFRGGEPRGISGEGRSAVSPSVGGGGFRGGESRGFSEGRSFGSPGGFSGGRAAGGGTGGSRR